jgi:hypothetical protein
MKTEGLRNFTLIQGGGGEEESGNVSNPYGPKRAGLITSQPTSKVAQLSESLNLLDSKTDDLESRFYEVCVTLNLVMGLLVERKLIGTSIDFTEEEESK